MSFDPNVVSLKRAYDKNLITEVLPSDTILVFRGDNETNYHAYRLQYNQLLTLVGENNLFSGVYVDKPALDLITGVSGSFAIVYNDIIAPVLYVWNATDSIWVELASGSGIDHFKGSFTDYDTLSVEAGNLGDYAYIESPSFTRYDRSSIGWVLPRATNSYLGAFEDEASLPIVLADVLTNDLATVGQPGIPNVLYIASNDGNSVAWTKIGVANTDDLPEADISPTNLYFTPERVRHSFPRSDEVISKPPTSGGEVYTSTVVLYDQFKILSFSSSIPCRFRLYATSAYQAADELRTANTLPVGNHGCILDSSLGVGNTDNFLVSPNILVSSQTIITNEFFYTIDTLGGGDVAVDVTLQIVVISDDYFPS